EFLRRAIVKTNRFRSIIIAAPFIDEVGCVLLRDLDAAAAVHGVALRVVTTPTTAEHVRRSLRQNRIFVCSLLHAKVYAALGKDPADHEAIVSSANLTGAALDRNFELGICLKASTPPFAAMIQRIVAAVTCMPRAIAFQSKVRNR